MNRSASAGRMLLLAVLGLALAFGLLQLLRTVYQDLTLVNNTPLPQDAAGLQNDTRAPISIDTLLQARLFGNGAAARDAVVREEAAPETRLSLELKGVFSSNLSDSSAALIAERGKTADYYRVGDRLPGGATLERVASNHVELRRNGRLERLSFSPPGTVMPGSSSESVEPSSPLVNSAPPGAGEHRVEALRERLRQLREAQKQLQEP